MCGGWYNFTLSACGTAQESFHVRGGTIVLMTLHQKLQICTVGGPALIDESS
jgi:hypothetical protein